ncbi:MAG TPA: response regulator [Burkholderiales bacterium]|nr:response regulator [Burkholderiales bacterium]
MEKDLQLRKVAHDLKNCLAPLRNALRLLERAEADASTGAYARGLIEKQLLAMERLCDSLLVEAPRGAEAATGGAAHASPLDGAGGRRSILLVDDNRAWVDSLALILRDQGHTVYTAYGGRRAIEIAEDLKPEVVILDIEMPEVSGYEAARQLRRKLSKHRPTLIALTVWNDDMDKALAREAGFDHHLSKPMAFDDLVRFLAAA